ncbi:DUF1080 domain-containing protein [Prolixibacteraceae bacterium JC049]|nr:DUF1080 domain-containing protein [Prolixibacteraceae bacterium JC049]
MFFMRLSIVVFAMLAIGGCKPQKREQQVDFKSIFNGEKLDGWTGDSTYWRVENGCLVGEVTPETILKRNSFIIWQGGNPSDFELKADFRVSSKGNSGINYRSELVEGVPFALKGYQADLDGRNRYNGQNYEERKRTTLAYRGEQVTVKPMSESSDFGTLVSNNAWKNRTVTSLLSTPDSLKAVFKKGKWNHYHIIAKGNRLKHFLNGVLMSDVVDADTINASCSGYIGVQVHVGPPMKVEFKNILLKETHSK